MHFRSNRTKPILITDYMYKIVFIYVQRFSENKARMMGRDYWFPTKMEYFSCLLANEIRNCDDAKQRRVFVPQWLFFGNWHNNAFVVWQFNIV